MPEEKESLCRLTEREQLEKIGQVQKELENFPSEEQVSLSESTDRN